MGGVVKKVARFVAPVVGFAFGGPVGAMVASGLGTVATGGNRHEALRSGLLAGAGGAIGGAIGGAGQALGGIAGSVVGGSAVDRRKEIFAQAMMGQNPHSSLPHLDIPSSVGEALGTQSDTLIGRVAGFETPYMRMLNKRHQSYGFRNWKRLMKKSSQ